MSPRECDCPKPPCTCAPRITAAEPAPPTDGLRERIADLAEQWDDIGRDHEEQGFMTAATIYRAHARHLRRALDGDR